MPATISKAPITESLYQTPERDHFIRQVSVGWKYRLYLLWKIPAAFRSGIRLEKMSYEGAIVSVPFKRFTQNPFRSTYFACLSMAAELSTGILVKMGTTVGDPGVSMLITQMDAQFVKKAKTRTYFHCDEGAVILAAVEETRATGEPVEVTIKTIGKNAEGEKIAEFQFTWWLRARQ